MHLTVKMLLKKNQNPGNGQMDRKNENDPRGLFVPALVLYTCICICIMTIIVKQVYWYVSQISGECLHDHGSSGFKM